MKQLIPFIIAIIAVLIILKDPHLPGHYVLSHYDSKDLTLQIAWGLGVGGVCLGLAKVISKAA